MNTNYDSDYVSFSVTFPNGDEAFCDENKSEAANSDVALKWAILEMDKVAHEW